MTDESILSKYQNKLEHAKTADHSGRVLEVTGNVIRASAPGTAVGDVVSIVKRDGSKQFAEVVGFKREQAVLMPLGDTTGIGPDAIIEDPDGPLSIIVGDALLGRVLDGIGNPIDNGPDLIGKTWPIMRAAPHPLARTPIDTPLRLGIRSIDGLLTVGEGQRVGLFAGSGVGKSTLMSQIAKGCDADIVVICLVGERGREVRDFIDEVLVDGAREKSIVVCATSDQPSLVRLKSAFVATAIAEYFRDEGKRVLLIMDSLTRFARAQREIGLASGEPPARRGFPPSVFTLLPQLLERTGRSSTGSITAIYTVLVEGGDMEEPIADEVRGILDGHIILSRKLAERNHWPAVDILPSLSRVMNKIVSDEHRLAAGKFREVLATFESKRDLIALGAYEYGTDEATDFAIDVIEELEMILKQGTDEYTPFHETIDAMLAVLE